MKRKRRWYDFPIIGLNIIVAEGWSSFWWKSKAFIRYRIKRDRSPQVSKSREEEILEAPPDKVEASGNPIENYLGVRLLYFLTQYGNKLSFPKFDEPIVSIILLTCNKAEFTYQCLESILAHTEIHYELILVDNGSTDETDALFERLENITKIINKENLGFIKGCNQGASQARGKYLMFLNNDTITTPNWLSNLVRTIESSPMYGAVGCKLVNVRGTLQEAGSIVWNDGTALGYGREDHPLRPEYSYLREVDYCSGACLLVRRELFRDLGGFDERYTPAYYEDSDLCMGIWKLGYKVIFEPEVIVFHHEFTSTGSFEKAKVLMESNRKAFAKKWAIMLKEKMAPSLNNVLAARDRRRGEKVLFLDDRIPASYQGSGYPRTHHMLKCLSELGSKVTFFPLTNTTPWQPYTHEFQSHGVEMFYGKGLNFLNFAEKRGAFYNFVIISRFHNMKRNIDTVRESFPNAIVIYDSEALFSMREILKAEIMGVKLKKGKIEGMSGEEFDLMKRADFIITVSKNEKAMIERAGIDHVAIWGHSLSPKGSEKGFNERSDILFIGGFLSSESPNEDAVLHFARRIFPTIQKELGCKFFIVGTSPPDSVKKLSSPSTTVTGYVEDLREYYDRCRIFVVPHRFCSGISIKLLEAMSYGIPSVVSSLIASQLNLEDRRETLIAESAEAFIDHCIDLYRNETLWYQIQQNALSYIQETCNPETLKNKLHEIMKRARELRRIQSGSQG